MTDLAIRSFVDQFGELPELLVLDYVSEMSNCLAGIPPNSAYIRLAQWVLAVKSDASDEAEYFSDNVEIPPSSHDWLVEKILTWPEMPKMYSATDVMDELFPDRGCAWCFHPRNSPECNFADRHPRYVEMFKGF